MPVNNVKWRLDTYDPGIFDCLDASDPPEWRSFSVLPTSGLNVFGNIKYVSPNYQYMSNVDCAGGMINIAGAHLYKYSNYGSKQSIMGRWIFENGATLTLNNAQNNTYLTATLQGGGRQTQGSMSWNAIRTQLGKIGDPSKTGAILSFIWDYTYQLDGQVPTVGLALWVPMQKGIKYPLDQFPLMILMLGSNTINTILTGAQIDDTDLGDDSTPAGGGGSFSYVDDNIDWPDLPVDSILSTDFIKLYHIDAAALTSIGNQLWSSNFFDTILKNYDSPFENIIALNILPFVVGGTPGVVYIGNYDTSVGGDIINTQFVDLDGGTVRIPKIFGNQLDFSPASTAQIYIPFIGYRDIDLDDLSGGTATLKYRVDVLTGNLLAMLRITQSDRYSHDSVEYWFNGNCATSVPISGANYMGLYSNIINGAMGAVGMAAGGNLIGAAGGVSSILTSKPTYQRSGNLSGNIGFMGQTRAYIMLNSPISSIAGNIKHLDGIQSNIYTAFSGLSGYQQIDSYTPSTALAAACTDEELTEIKNLLQEGVYF